MKPNIARQTSHESKTDYSSEGGIIKSYPNYSNSLSFTQASRPPSPSASLQSTTQHHLPTTAVAEWMMSNRVGEWGHYRDVELWIGTPEPSFALHSRLLLTLKCASHLTLSGETGVSARFRSIFLMLKQAGLFWEGPLQCFPKCWMEAMWEAAVKCNVLVSVCVEISCPQCFSLQAWERKSKRVVCVVCSLHTSRQKCTNLNPNAHNLN